MQAHGEAAEPPPAPRQQRQARALLCAVAWGQVISLVVASSNVFLKLLVERKKVEYSFFQNALGYGLIALVFGLISRRQRRSGRRWPRRGVEAADGEEEEEVVVLSLESALAEQRMWWTRVGSIMVIAVLDSFAGYADVLAYQFGESISSLGLLASFTIPSSMLFSYCLLHSRFSMRHFAGVFLAMLGMALVIFIDTRGSSSSSSSNADAGNKANMKWAGDLLVLLGSGVYALDNVLSERLLKNAMDWKEYLFYLGSFGFAFSLLASLITEWSHVLKTPFFTDGVVVAYLLAYAVSFLAIYGLIAKYFIVYDAVAMNLSLLTTSVWGAICDFVVFDDLLNAATLFGFFFIVGGVTLYHTTGSATGGGATTTTAAAGGGEWGWGRRRRRRQAKARVMGPVPLPTWAVVSSPQT